MKNLRCSDLGFSCESVVKADSEEKVQQIPAKHVKDMHGVNVISEMQNNST